MIRWLRVVLPTNYLLGAGLLFLLLAGIPVLARLAFMREVAFPLEDPAGLGLIGMLAAAYGVYRVAAYHPIYQKEYREWLERTPWRFGLPLPLGPVHLVLQDLVPLAILLGLALLFEQFEWRHAPALFAGPYLLALMAALAITRQIPHAYWLAWGLGGIVYLSDTPELQWPLLIGSYLLALHGLRKSLQDFRSWNLEWMETQTIIQTKQEIVREKILGWPYDRLGPHEIKQDLTAAQAVAIVFLVAWWVFVVMSKIPGQEHIVMFAFAAMFGNLLAAIRLITYVWGYAPPISLWGRIRTGRWIIPGYDVVFVAPLMILLLASVMAYAVFKLRMDPLMAVPLLVAAQLYATVKFPPGLMDWRLTHNHRIIPAIGSQAAELQQTQ